MDKKDKVKDYLEKKYIGFIIKDIFADDYFFRVNMIFDEQHFRKYDCTPTQMYVEIYFGGLGIEELSCILS